ncbi:hypothetical protein EV06_1518 [Prochlorococcus sp. MIT 0602]|nr:hypothetical protein EV06_1518 [Prochlorococcus sp. MIT 0602]
MSDFQNQLTSNSLFIPLNRLDKKCQNLMDSSQYFIWF